MSPDDVGLTPPSDNGAEGTKTTVTDEVIEGSVQGLPTGKPPNLPTTDAANLLWFIAGHADLITPWGRASKLRDAQLATFSRAESYWTSALGTVCVRNAAFSWNIEGPSEVATRYHDVLDNANNGEGWQDFTSKLSWDLYTQDSGAFIEYVREDNRDPASPVIGINSLESARCWHTGWPNWPVIYQDKRGIYHLLAWWNVSTISELPMPVEKLPGLQLCATSRLLRHVQIGSNTSQIAEEKSGGRFEAAIHMIKGLSTDEINDALAKHHTQANAMGLSKYIRPLIVGSIDPKADVGKETLEMATMPEGWDEEKHNKVYIGLIAMALFEDYQTFAPLPGGNLGTSTQSETLARKSRGKGPGLFMGLIQHHLNFRMLPKGVDFYFDEQDLEAESQEAEVRKVRADTYKLYIDTGLSDAEGVRQLALDAGDIPQELFDRLKGKDLTPTVVATESALAVANARAPGQQQAPAQRLGGPKDEVKPGAEQASKELDAAVQRAVDHILGPSRFKFEDYV